MAAKMYWVNNGNGGMTLLYAKDEKDTATENQNHILQYLNMQHMYRKHQQKIVL